MLPLPFAICLLGGILHSIIYGCIIPFQHCQYRSRGDPIIIILPLLLLLVRIPIVLLIIPPPCTPLSLTFATTTTSCQTLPIPNFRRSGLRPPTATAAATALAPMPPPLLPLPSNTGPAHLQSFLVMFHLLLRTGRRGWHDPTIGRDGIDQYDGIGFIVVWRRRN